MVMQGLFAPAIALMNRLNYTRKFTLLGLLALIATVVVTFNLYLSLEQVIHSSRHELDGLKRIQTIARCIQLVQQHRGLSAGALSGIVPMQHARTLKEQEAAAALGAMAQQLPADLRTDNSFQHIQTDWENLRRQGMRWKTLENFDAHTRLIEQLLIFEMTIADRYALTMDPDVGSHYLIASMTNNLPHATERLGRIRAYGTGILSIKQASSQQKIVMGSLLAELENTLVMMKINLDKTARHNPAIAAAVAAATQEITASSSHTINIVRTNIFQDAFTTTPETFYAAATTTIDNIYAQIDRTLLPAAETLINARISRAENILRLSMGTAFLLFLTVLYFAIGGYFAVTRSIHALALSARAFAKGDLQHRALLDTQDELKLVGSSFNEMADGFTALLEARQEDEARLRSIISTAMEAVVQMDSDGLITGWNAQAEKTFGWTREEVLGRPMHEIIIPHRYREAHIRGRHHFLTTNEGPVLNRRIEITALRRGGEEFPIELAVSPHKLDSGFEFSAFIRDISERKRTEEKLTLAARVFEEAQEAILITNNTGEVIIDVNPAFTTITGYSREDALGQSPQMLSSGKHGAGFYASLWDTLNQQGHWRGEIWNRKKNGDLYAELLTISAMRDEDGNVLHYVGLFSDITHSKHQQEALEVMAHYDPLTRLPNRTLFADRFAQAIARTRRDDSLLAICYLDLDGFKQVNDSKGHETGDQLLIQVAERIKDTLREEDTVSRLGGDEFALLLGNINSLELCEQAVNRINESLAAPYTINDEQVSVSASIGVTLYPTDDADPDTLLRHADQAMYLAKQGGRNCYHLFDAMQDQAVQSRNQLLSTLEEAFAREEFCLYYQPKVNMMTGDIVGAEALIRWNHPKHGILLPSEFLSVVEGSQFDIVLGNWVMDEAIRQLDIWRQQGLSLKVSVNISPKHLQWGYFATQLEATLAQYPEVPSSLLELEMLESSILEDFTAVRDVITTCRKKLGVSVALDDFGTGYSSLIHLRHVPADVIKIDQSFVRDMIDDPNDFAIVNGVIGMSQAFRREVIAEGVESVEHGLALLSMGCTLAQGYGIARPMSADDILDWTRSYTACAEWKAYAGSPPSPRETELLLLKVESEQWLSRLETCLNNSPDTPAQHWPIMNPKKCHCGRWIEQAKSDKHFSTAELNRLEQAHEELHRIGNTLMQQHLNGEHELARAGIHDLRNTYLAVEKFIDQ